MFRCFWFYILICIFTTTKNNYVQCVCRNTYATICDSMRDVLEEPLGNIFWWKEVVIGNEESIPRYNLTEQYLRKFRLAKSLEKLTIINQLNGIETSGIINIPKSLVLYGNNLPIIEIINIPKSLGPPIIKKLPFHVSFHFIDLLSLKNNDIKDIKGLFFHIYGTHLYISILDLSHNKLKELNNYAFNRVRVEKLILKHNHLNLIRTPYGLPQNIQQLYLDHNRFSSLLNMHLTDFDTSHLILLSISHNRLSHIYDLPTLKTLKRLDLSFNNIQDVGDVFHRLENLHFLNLRGNDLTTFSFPNNLSSNSAPYIYILSFNRLRTLELEHVQNVEMMLSLSGNPWNCVCIQEMENILKNSSTNLRRGACDENLSHSGVMPYCVIRNYISESCYQEDISEEQMEFFMEHSKKYLLNDTCDIIDVYMNQ